MGFLGIIQNDIKRVVAYSTLSQLGYMTVALGVSAYSAGVFHLMTHAFFKALLFLGAGSVIIGMHHDQDIRNMGGLRKYMPITWITSLIGSLALIGTPFFSGFYSKDSIILAVEHSEFGWVSTYATFAVLAGVFVTAFYSFRMYFLVFHGKERFRHKPFPGEHDHADAHGHAHVHVPHESPAVVWVPLVALAIPSVVIGFIAIGPMLAVDSSMARSSSMPRSIRRWSMWPSTLRMPCEMGLHAILTPPFWLALAGVVAAWFLYLKRPELADVDRQHARAAAQAAREQVLLRLVQRERARARVSRGLGLAAVECRRQGHHRWRAGEWLGAYGGLAGRHRAPRADRLPLLPMPSGW